MTKNIAIIGAGPAGLTAAFELLERSGDFHPVILEATDRIGGISCTINHNGNRIDIGGHRFFSKSDTVMDWWAARMPLQGAPARDDKILGRIKPWAKEGPDPEKSDRMMLIRERISRIYYLRKFFDYPISLKPQTVLNLGLWRTFTAGLGYMKAQLIKRPEEKTLEDFMINRFGVPLYRMFFEDYTEKVWGVHPSKISADWGAQRIKGLSLSKAVLAALTKLFSGSKPKDDLRQKDTETSLIEQFFYPKFGPGHLWECVADDIRAKGGEILMQHRVVQIHQENGKVVAVTTECNGERKRIECDACLSSMPIKDLVAAMDAPEIPAEIRRIAEGLPYRDFMTVGVLVDKMAINNTTDIPTIGNIVPDTWIYIQERDVRLCRLQVFNNWSPYMVRDPEKTVWIGLEYMCAEGDELWEQDDETFCRFAVRELASIGVIDESAVIDTCRFRIEKAYPAYFGTYGEFDTLRAWLDGIGNLYCVGRNGQHRYNNQDHSMLTAMEAVSCLLGSGNDRKALWSVNSEGEYHETKKSA